MKERVYIGLILLLSLCFGFFAGSLLVEKYRDSNFEFTFDHFFSQENFFGKSALAEKNAETPRFQETEIKTNEMSSDEIVGELRTLWRADVPSDPEPNFEREKKEEKNQNTEIPHKVEAGGVVQNPESLIARKSQENISPSADSFEIKSKEEVTLPSRFPQKTQKTDAEVAQEILAKVMKYESVNGRKNTLQKELKNLPSNIGSLGVLNALVDILPQSLKGDAINFRKEFLK